MRSRIFDSPKISKVRKETVWSALTKGVTLVLFVLINAILARRMGVESYGSWSYFFSVFNIILLISILGINSSVRINLRKHYEDKLLRPILRWGVFLRLCVTLFACSLLYFFAQPLADLLKRPEYGSLLELSIFLLFAQAVVEFLKEVFQGLHRIKYNLIINTIEYGSKFLFLLLLLPVGRHYENVIIYFTLGALIASVIGGMILYFSFYKHTEESQSKYIFNNIIKSSFFMFVISVAGLVSLELNTILLGYLSNDMQVGIYAPAKELSFKMQHMAAILGIGVLPAFAKMSAGQVNYHKILFKKVMVLIALAYIVIGVVIVTLSDWFMPFIFGEQFRESATVLKLLFPFNLFAGLIVILAGVMDYRGLANKRAVYLVLTMIINLLLSWALIPQYGAKGVAIAMCIAYFPYLLLCWSDVRKELHFGRSVVYKGKL